MLRLVACQGATKVAANLVQGVVLLLVAHTWQNQADGQEHIQIISARRATKQERKVHEQGA